MNKDDYNEYLKSDHWQEVREKQLLQDEHRCAFCGSTEKLEVHHINYKNLYNEKPGCDTITFCDTCHRKYHRIREAYIEKSKSIKQKYIDAVQEAMKPLAETYYEEASEVVAHAAFAFLGGAKVKNYGHLVKTTCELLELDNTSQIPVCCPSPPRSEELGGRHGVYNDACNKLSALRKQAKKG